MPTLEDVLDYLGYDYADDNIKRNINRAISTAEAYLKGSLGKNYPVDDPRVKELSLIVTADLYENRTINDKVSGNVRKLVNDLELQIKLEMRSGTSE